ncbi:MAG: hypothetical protein NZ518_04365 [Dehalococcoidia bacterium]|nr:hypothetical protein [Dehalococcoidia bacterium]
MTSGARPTGADERLIAVVWALAVVTTLLSAGLLLELAKSGILLIHGMYHGLPWRVSVSVGSIVLFGVLLVAPATVCQWLWSWLKRHCDPATVTTGFLLLFLLLSVAWPALLARDIAFLLGR